MLNIYFFRGKKLKTILKEFLKKAENRNNLHFYREFALIEFEQGRLDSSINILETALHSVNSCPATISSIDEKTAVMSIYRSLFEILLNVKTYRESNKNRLLKVAESFVPHSAEDRLIAVENYLQDSIQQYLCNNVLEESEDAFFFPNLVCDTITCYAYLLFAQNRQIIEISNMFRNYLEHCKEYPRLQVYLDFHF